jgi:hypothetical protein
MQNPPISSLDSVVGPSLTVRLRPANLSVTPSELVGIPSAERNISSVTVMGLSGVLSRNGALGSRTAEERHLARIKTKKKP